MSAVWDGQDMQTRGSMNQQDATVFGSERYVTDHGHNTLPIISYNFVKKILLQWFYGSITGKKLSVISRAASYIINVTAKMTPLSVI